MKITHVLTAGALVLAAAGSALALTSASSVANASDATTSLPANETVVTQGVRQLEELNVARITVLDASTGQPIGVKNTIIPRYFGQ